MKYPFLFILLFGIMSCSSDSSNDSNLNNPSVMNKDIVACGVQNPQSKLPWLAKMIKKADTDKTLNYLGTIWLENHKGEDVFITNMMLGSGGIAYWFFDCQGNAFDFGDNQEANSFISTMKLDVVVYSNAPVKGE